MSVNPMRAETVGALLALALIMKNLTDERVASYANDVSLAGNSFGAPGFFGFVEPPRTFTVQAQLRH